MSSIINFYRGTGTDVQGRFLKDYFGQGDGWLEECHDHIQWMFPLPEPSMFNPDAPILTDEDIAVFKTDLDTFGSLPVVRCVGMMIDFYCSSPQWISPRNHNFLRITRIIRFLSLIGWTDLAKGFRDMMKAVALAHKKTIPDDTLAYWEAALDPDHEAFK